MQFDRTGKQIFNLDGKYLIQTTANVIYYSHGGNKREMNKLFHLPASSNSKTFLVEVHGILLITSSVTEFEIQRVGDYENFNAKNLN